MDATLARRLHPKLRLLANCSAAVLAARAATQGTVSLRNATLARAVPDPAATLAPGASDRAVAKVGDLDTSGRSKAATVGVFVRSTGSVATGQGERKLGRLAMLRRSLDDVQRIAADPTTIAIEPAAPLTRPSATLGRAHRTVAAPPRRRGRPAAATKPLVGIIDVEGFDWLHPDFQGADGTTRFLRIWDQGAQDGPRPTSFTYGREISQAEMRQAQADAPHAGVSPHDLLPQTEMQPGSHGTHVASIAAGNRGACPEAEILAVLVSVPAGDLSRRMSFYDSTRLIDAVHYLLAAAGDRPISINISLGTNGHAHDASGTLDRWLDALLVEPGRAICVAAGNAGQERGEAPDDLGYMLGRVHAAGRIAAQGLDHELEWQVVGDGVKDVSENELEIWYEAQDRFAVSIRPPGGDWIGPVAPGQFLENLQLRDRTMLSIYNELHHPANGANLIAVYLTPFLGRVRVGIRPGVWQVRLHGLVVRDGQFHAWIERDDPYDIGDGTMFWPSFFTERSNTDASSVSSLACGHRIVSVGNLDAARQVANISSSQGPTRDGRPKPDLCAPGTDIIAANGFADGPEPWIAMTGTSMASPYVAGVVARMLAAAPHLTAAQVLGILRATAQPLPGGTYAWTSDCGFGRISPDACVAAAEQAGQRQDLKGRFE